MSRKEILDRKIMGISYYFPYVLYIFLFCSARLVYKQEYGNHQIALLYEMSIPFFISWWAVYSLYDYLEEEGGIVLFTFRRKMEYFVLKNNLHLTFKYIVQSGIYMLLSTYFLLGEIDIRILISIMIENFFFSSASFFLMSCLSDSNWSLMILFVYVCAGYFTNGEILGCLNIFLLRYDGNTWWDVFYHALKCISFSIIFYIVGIAVIKRHCKIYQLFSRKM